MVFSDYKKILSRNIAPSRQLFFVLLFCVCQLEGSKKKQGKNENKAEATTSSRDFSLFLNELARSFQRRYYEIPPAIFYVSLGSNIFFVLFSSCFPFNQTPRRLLTTKYCLCGFCYHFRCIFFCIIFLSLLPIRLHAG